MTTLPAGQRVCDVQDFRSRMGVADGVNSVWGGRSGGGVGIDGKDNVRGPGVVSSDVRPEELPGVENREGAGLARPDPGSRGVAGVRE